MAYLLKCFVGDRNSYNAEGVIPRKKYINAVQLTSMTKISLN
jgi:hypothetical protein